MLWGRYQLQEKKKKTYKKHKLMEIKHYISK